MGWKGSLRSINASSNRAEKENERRRALRMKIGDQQMASTDVKEYESYLLNIRNMHVHCCDRLDWTIIKNSEAPIEPIYVCALEEKARNKLKYFKPNFFHRLFKLEKRTIAKLEKSINSAIAKDKANHSNKMNEYHSDLDNWKKEQSIAYNMLNKDILTLKKIVETQSDLMDDSLIASSINYKKSENGNLIVDINVHGEDIVPKHSKSLTMTGKLSVKALPKSTYYEIYQDYVCSAVLRVARELFAISVFDTIIVNAVDDLVNTSTGHIENMTILSVMVSRMQIDKINFKRIDPSDAIANFIHKMNFKKTTGFVPVEQLID